MSAAPLAGATRYRGWPAAGVALAVAAPIGVAAVAAPTVAAAATGGIVLAAIVARAPALFLGFAFVALAYSPEYLDSSLGPLTRPELQKGLIYVGLLAMALVRGVDPRRILPVFAYAVLAVLGYLHGDLALGLTEQQMASTFVTLTAGWIAIAIRWDWRRDARYLKVLCCIAPLCVALGVLLNAAGLHALWDTPTSFDASYRLRGASIAAQLGLTAFGGSAVAYVAWRLLRWRPALWLLSGQRGDPGAHGHARRGDRVRHRRRRTGAAVRVAAARPSTADRTPAARCRGDRRRARRGDGDSQARVPKQRWPVLRGDGHHRRPDERPFVSVV